MSRRVRNISSASLGTDLQSTDSVTTQSGGDTLLQATHIQAPKIDLQTGVGASAQADAKLILEGAKETTQTYHTESDTSLLWLKMKGEGDTTDTLKLAKLVSGLAIFRRLFRCGWLRYSAIR
jgi:hypothetical protein